MQCLLLVCERGSGVGLFVVDALSVVDDGRLQLEYDDDDVVANCNG